VVEQASALLNEGNAELLSSLEDRYVVLAATRSRDILDARASCAVDVVDKWELAGVSESL